MFLILFIYAYIVYNPMCVPTKALIHMPEVNRLKWSVSELKWELCY